MKNTAVNGEGLALWTRWHKEVAGATAAFAAENDVLVAFVPLMAGEANGGHPMLRHERLSAWHWSRAGHFYHVEGFLSAYSCARGIGASKT